MIGGAVYAGCCDYGSSSFGDSSRARPKEPEIGDSLRPIKENLEAIRLDTLKQAIKNRNKRKYSVLDGALEITIDSNKDKEGFSVSAGLDFKRAGEISIYADGNTNSDVPKRYSIIGPKRDVFNGKFRDVVNLFISELSVDNEGKHHWDYSRIKYRVKKIK